MNFSQSKESIYELLELIDQFGTIRSETQWLRIRNQFDLIYPSFFRSLRMSGVIPSTKEERILILTKLNYKVSEIAEILNVRVETVHTANYRFRKKHNLSADLPFKMLVEQLAVYR